MSPFLWLLVSDLSSNPSNLFFPFLDEKKKIKIKQTATHQLHTGATFFFNPGSRSPQTGETAGSPMQVGGTWLGQQRQRWKKKCFILRP